jgi:hypothetical protein
MVESIGGQEITVGEKMVVVGENNQLFLIKINQHKGSTIIE